MPSPTSQITSSPSALGAAGRERVVRVGSPGQLRRTLVRLADCVSTLGLADRELLQRRAGSATDRPASLRQLARRAGISQGRVRQRLRVALTRLRRAAHHGCAASVGADTAATLGALNGPGASDGPSLLDPVTKTSAGADAGAGARSGILSDLGARAAWTDPDMLVALGLAALALLVLARSLSKGRPGL